MHYLQSLAQQVDKTHSRLGNLVAVMLLTAKARKCLLVVSPSGCGKSASMQIVRHAYSKSIMVDGISIAALGQVAKEWEGFDGIVMVDDIAKNQTEYSRRAAVTTMAELCYSHFVERYFKGAGVSLARFNGGVAINLQPVMLKGLVGSSEWEASVQDKTLRYYHLYRPLDPCMELPELKLDAGIEIKEVADPSLKGELIERLFNLGQVQWSRARVREHIRELLKSAAAWDSRPAIEESDYELLFELLRPMAIEQWALGKSGFESDRKLNSNLLAILVEFASYGNFTLRQLSMDYKVSQSTAYRLMMQQQKDWVMVAKSPTVYAPSEDMKVRLKEIGLA